MDIIQGNHQLKECGLVATIGMFDGVHLGHQFLIEDLRKVASEEGLSTAVITFRDHPQCVLRPGGDLRMIMPLEERLRIIGELGVDAVIVMDFTPELADLESREFMKLLMQDYGVQTLVMGFNHRFGCNKDEYFEDYVVHGEEIGLKVVRAREYQGEYSPVSSSLIRKMIEEGRVDLAKCYLSRPFELSGVVVYGKQNGRKIGFPTANLDVPSHIIVPHRGVYTVKVTLENGEKYGGMANIGVRPTIERGGARTIEVNIFDFDGDLYGSVLTVEFVKFMRSEVRFSSFEELKQRLFVDREACRAVLS